MKKRLLFLCACIISLLLLSGCIPAIRRAKITMYAKCKPSLEPVSQNSKLIVEVTRKDKIIKSFVCRDCDSIPISFRYELGKEDEYYILMTVTQDGMLEEQGLSFKKILNSKDFLESDSSKAIYSYRGDFCKYVRPPVTGDTGVTSNAEFTLVAICKGEKLSANRLQVEVTYGKQTHSFECSECSSIPVSFEYVKGKESNYSVKMTAFQGGGSEAQSLPLSSIIKASGYPKSVLFSYGTKLCGPIDDYILREFGPHWNEK